MRKNTIISGVVILVIGLIMWIMGQNAYENAVLFSLISSNKPAIEFWTIFTSMGFLIFIIGIIVSIAGTIQNENTSIFRRSKCFKCGERIREGVNFCSNCGTEFEWK